MAFSSITVRSDRFAHNMVVDNTANTHVRISSNQQGAARYTTQLMNMSNAGGLFWPSGGVNRKSIIHAMVISLWTQLRVQLNPDVVIENISTPFYQHLVASSTFGNDGTILSDKNYIVPRQAALLLSLLASHIGQRVNLGIIVPTVAGGREHTFKVIGPPHSSINDTVIWIYCTDPVVEASDNVFYAGYVTAATMDRSVLNLRPNQWMAPKSGLQPSGEARENPRHVPNKFSNVPFYQELLQSTHIWPGSDRSVRYLPSQVATEAGQAERTTVWHRMESAVKFYFGNDIWQRFKFIWKANYQNDQFAPAETLETLLEFPTR